MGRKAVFSVMGPFFVRAASGEIITPRGTKERGLLLLLATSPSGARERAWLQDKLWSDRGRAQGAGSLRQALTQIRSAFGDHRDLVRADRLRVTLDLERAEVDRSAAGEFAEGLDVRDEEFEYWLSVQRSAAGVTVAAEATAPMAPAAAPGASAEAGTPDLVIVTDAAGDSAEGEAAWNEAVIADGIARSLRENFSGLVAHDPGRAPAPGDWTLRVRARPAGGNGGNGGPGLALRLALSDAASGRQIWAGSRTVEDERLPATEHPGILQLHNEVVEAVGDRLLALDPPGAEAGPDALVRRGIRKLFAMTPQTVAEADACFARAGEMQEGAVALAWRAQVKTVQRIERHGGSVRELQEQAELFVARALEREPGNSLVLAMLANTRLFLFQDAPAAAALSRRAVEINPANPMAWWAHSSALLYCGERDAAYRTAVCARHLARLSPHRYWWDLQQFAAAMASGRLDEAVALLEACSAQCRSFRPPLRYLVALHANAGDEDRAVEAAARLRALEPDFAVERLLRDRDYPVRLLHKVPEVNLDRLRAIA